MPIQPDQRRAINQELNFKVTFRSGLAADYQFNQLNRSIRSNI
ncbi:intraflagellar transport protein IFT72/74 [Corchorus olitorius]|uniref:Intraflagellar transport protein IFT72/74 n=1 Tax=Corchorus olitorius TaxID=93759 RepID=A0A1R3H753_9ROSI|nr:intraflagellar transport protein IFT72/74 [Corchorus olitorius]